MKTEAVTSGAEAMWIRDQDCVQEANTVQIWGHN